ATDRAMCGRPAHARSEARVLRDMDSRAPAVRLGKGCAVASVAIDTIEYRLEAADTSVILGVRRAYPLLCARVEGGPVGAVDGNRQWPGKRERLVDLLERAGVLRGVMQLRRLSPLPIVGIFTFHHIHDPEAAYPYDPEVADATPR